MIADPLTVVLVASVLLVVVVLVVQTIRNASATRQAQQTNPIVDEIIRELDASERRGETDG